VAQQKPTDRPRKAPTCGGSRSTDRHSLPRLRPRSASHAAKDLNSYTYHGYAGLARDVSFYAEQVLNRAWEALSADYPSLPGEAPVAWLWARTATCPNPACGGETLLATTWWLSKKVGELAWIQPQVEDGRVVLDVVAGQKQGEAPPSPKVGDGVFACVICASPLDGKYLRSEASAGRMGLRITSVAADVDGKRIYRPPTKADSVAAEKGPPKTLPPACHSTPTRWACGSVGTA